jgi:hypothetical protein
MTRGRFRLSRKPVYTLRGHGRARDDVLPNIIQEPDLGACAGCNSFMHDHSYEIVDGRVAIHCGLVHGKVFPRTDISSHEECLAEVLTKAI